MDLVNKYGPVAAIGASIGLGLSVLDPFRIKRNGNGNTSNNNNNNNNNNNSNNSNVGRNGNGYPAWLVTLYQSPLQMALIGAVLGVLIFYAYEMFMQPRRAVLIGEAELYNELRPHHYYSRKHLSRTQFVNRVPIRDY